MSLPLYFAIRHGQGYQYKVFQNTVYSCGKMLNVLWPIKEVVGQRLTVKQKNEAEHISLIRSWNGTAHNCLKWSYSGASVRVLFKSCNAKISVPVITVALSTLAYLPFNPDRIDTTDQEFLHVEDETTYKAARIYYTDPNAVENTKPVASIPIAPVYTLPAHIAKIVLADAIRKNEVCPITSEEITEANATVTPCGHVFCKSALKEWLSGPISKGLCPVCKQAC